MQTSPNRFARRIAISAVIALLTLIPTLIIQLQIDARQDYNEAARTRVAASWGGPQTIIGPVLIVSKVQAPGEWQVVESAARALAILPSALDSEIDQHHEMRNVGIFQVPTYNAKLSISGRLTLPAQDESYDWQNAALSVGISDTSAITFAQLRIDGQQMEIEPSGLTPGLGEGFHVRVNTRGKQQIEFDLELGITGTDTLYTATFGAQSNTTIRSDWPHPKFIGHRLPNQKEVTADGFAATWRSHSLAQGFPLSWELDDVDHTLSTKRIGVELYQPITAYRATERAIKYAVLFVVITFLTLHALEAFFSLQFHVLQLITTAASLLLFYLFLLSLGEHLVFGWAFILSSSVVVGTTAIYIYLITRSPQLGFIFAGVLTLTYLILYVLLQLEDLALLSGTVLLFCTLLMVMTLTKNLRATQETQVTES